MLPCTLPCTFIAGRASSNPRAAFWPLLKVGVGCVGYRKHLWCPRLGSLGVWVRIVDSNTHKFSTTRAVSLLLSGRLHCTNSMKDKGDDEQEPRSRVLALECDFGQAKGQRQRASQAKVQTKAKMKGSCNYGNGRDRSAWRTTSWNEVCCTTRFRPNSSIDRYICMLLSQMLLLHVFVLILNSYFSRSRSAGNAVLTKIFSHHSHVSIHATRRRRRRRWVRELLRGTTTEDAGIIY